MAERNLRTVVGKFADAAGRWLLLEQLVSADELRR